jgi:hypothetical protein
MNRWSSASENSVLTEGLNLLLKAASLAELVLNVNLETQSNSLKPTSKFIKTNFQFNFRSLLLLKDNTHFNANVELKASSYPMCCGFGSGRISITGICQINLTFYL